jgi:hypothetical protein
VERRWSSVSGREMAEQSKGHSDAELFGVTLPAAGQMAIFSLTSTHRTDLRKPKKRAIRTEDWVGLLSRYRKQIARSTWFPRDWFERLLPNSKYGVLPIRRRGTGAAGSSYPGSSGPSRNTEAKGYGRGRILYCSGRVGSDRGLNRRAGDIAEPTKVDPKQPFLSAPQKAIA